MALSPLFQIYDPYGSLSDESHFGALPDSGDIEPLGIVPLKKRRPTVADLMPEEEKTSLLRDLAQTGASGLSTFGYLLDTPGAIMRGILAGKPLSGFGTSDERVSGRDLLRQWGMAGDKDNWGNFGSGLLAEVALDPLSYVGIGLLGRGANTITGNLAKRAGLLVDDVGLMAKNAGKGTAQFLRESTPQSLIDLAADPEYAMKMWRQAAGSRADELLNAPVRRMSRISFPGFQSGAADLLGQNVGDFMAKASDQAGAAIKGAPVIGPTVRAAQAMFDPRVLGFVDEDRQWLARELTDAERKAGRAADKYLSQLSVDVARDVGEETFRSPEFAKAFRDMMENQADQVKKNEAMWKLFQPGMPGGVLVQAAKDYQADAILRARDAGVKLAYTDLPNDIGYFFRQQVKPVNPTMAQGYAAPKNVRYDSGVDVFGVAGGDAQRRDYTRAFPTYVLDKMAQDSKLQDLLRKTKNGWEMGDSDVRQIIDNWLQENAGDFMEKLPPSPVAGPASPFDFMREPAKKAGQDAEEVLRAQYIKLADSIRRTPLEFAKEGLPKYGNALNDYATYVRARARNEATAGVLMRQLANNPILDDAGKYVSADMVPGGTAYSIDEALGLLNLDHWSPRTLADGTVSFSPAMEAFARTLNKSPADLTDVSIPKEFVDQLRAKVQKARAPQEAGPLLQLFDNMTQQFKTLALLWPARYSRDTYSGAFAGATQGAFNPLDWWAGLQARRGNYKPLVGRLRNAPGYGLEDLFPGEGTVALADDPVSAALPAGVRAVSSKELAEAQIRKFLTDAGGQGIGQSSVMDDMGRTADNLTYRGTFPGASGGLFKGMSRNPLNPQTYNLFALRGRQGNPAWLLELGDRLAEATDAGNRIGTYLSMIRKGAAPEAARATSDLTQVLYSPSNFTALERDVIKRLVPFYSYTKGITPLIAQELTQNPAGLMGQSIRAVTRGSEPKEDQFTPEYLRQSAAIPVGKDLPFFGLDTPGITRFLTNLDLPHEGALNLFTPGVGNSLTARIGDSLMKTGSNILGQSSPYIKGPLESILNRQFYSGRQLSDLYSMLEQSMGPIGRGVEQAFVNLPGGSRVLGTIRQLTDQRISPQERAAKFLFNTLTGLKFQDVDQEKTVRLAARTTLNQLLDQAKGMSTYENLFIKPEDLAQLSQQEQRQYLLYRILQSEAAKRAREKKKQDALMDPLASLGLG